MSLKQCVNLSLSVGLVCYAAGCASIISGSRYPVSVNSNVAGANVTIKDRNGKVIHSGMTPTTAMLHSGDGFFTSAKYVLYFEKDGYQTATENFSAGFNGWYIGNLLFGGPIGLLIVDPATGAMWELDNTVHANLTQLPLPTVNPPPKAVLEPIPTPPVVVAAVEKSTSIVNVSPKPEQQQSGVSAAVSTANPSVQQSIDQLKRLKALKDDGILTPEEYEVKRKQIIDKLSL